MGKRKPDEDGFEAPFAEIQRRKAVRLEDDVVAGPPRGVNYIEADGKTCTHEVAWPPADVDSTAEQSSLPPPPRPGKPAKEYPFRLDPFQQTAINCLETGHSVLVAAHTSAGKTAIAEYAFAMALRDGQRVIYTSPLKALSNQKYRELYEEFRDVGLMTGDVTINATASCLVMTTEILRSMLYRGSEIVRECQLVVYDEIHYLRDKERGVVWEESIVLMPQTSRFVFLSATIPNAREFAEWIATIHKSPCHVVYTDYRPTPLQHYVFPTGADGLFLVVDERGTFRQDNFQKAVAALTESTNAANEKGKGKGKKGRESKKEEETDIFKVVRMIQERAYAPVIVFSFSKRECEALAVQMVGLDLTLDDEKKLVDTIFHSAIDCLAEDERKLPQVQALLPMLRRGVGIHHSGLLPILKEVIEILFQEGLLKCLFATETFSTGLNMPAKTVVFTNCRKFDGGGFRWLSSGEYIQMSGRAGRRGLDDLGIVILLLDVKLEPAIAKEMVKGAPDPLYSEFHLGYAMLLNLQRVEGADPAALMAASYRQFQTQRALPALRRDLERLQHQHADVAIPDEQQVGEYLGLLQQAALVRADLRTVVHAPRYALPFLQPGRLLRILPAAPPPATTSAAAPQSQALQLTAGSAEQAPGPPGVVDEAVWGIVVNFEPLANAQRRDQHAAASTSQPDGAGAGGKGKEKGKRAYIVDVLVQCAEEGAAAAVAGPPAAPRLLPPGQPGVPLVVPVTLQQVDGLSTVRVYLAKDLRAAGARQAALKALQEVLRRFPAGLPLLDPQDDMAVDDPALRKVQRRAESLEAALRQHPLAESPTLLPRLQQFQQKEALAGSVKVAKKLVRAAEGLIMRDELKSRLRLLRRLKYMDDDGIVSVKGRVACEIASADELVLTEMIFGGAFNSLNPEQIAALLSCFIWAEKSDKGTKIREDLQGPFASLQETARRVGKLAAECKLAVDVEEYVAGFRPDLMEGVAAWFRGATFAEVLKATQIFEGSLVRAVRREEELLRQLTAAARAIGDTHLADKFEEAIRRIKRDIIFAASLYL